MIVGSTKENLSLEKRVSITPETAKNIINLGLKVIIENNYATHIGITDKEYEAMDVKIKNSSKEVLINCNLLTKVNCPSDEEILNRDYYRGRFVSKVKNREIFNWDEIELK